MKYTVEITGLSLADAESLISALRVNLPQWLTPYETLEMREELDIEEVSQPIIVEDKSNA